MTYNPQSDGVDHEYLRVLEAVGGVTTKFSKLEFHMDLAIWILSDQTSIENADAGTRSFKFKERLIRLKDLCYERLPKEISSYFGDMIQPRLTHANGLRSKKVVHAIIAISESPDGERFVCAVPRTHLITRNHRQFKISAPAIRKLSDDIGECSKIMLHFITHHLLQHVAPPPWWREP